MQHRRIVVGIDGSAGAAAALRAAVDEATAHGAALEIVHAWFFPWRNGLAGIASSIAVEELERMASEMVDAAMAEARDLGAPDVTATIARGPAAPALLEAAKGADLLVVGTRGLGGFAGLLLGSVSQQCVHHAPCPLLLVPSTQDQRTA